MYRIQSVISVAIILSLVAPARADTILGTWSRDDGEAKVKFDTCGDALCGTIVALKAGADSKAKIGLQVFFDMKPDGVNSWSGKAVNPKDGSILSGRISLTGNSMTTAGCIAGGLFCKSIQWLREQ